MEVVQVTAVADKFHPLGVASDNARYVAACIRYILSRAISLTVPGRQGRPENHLFLLAVLGVFGVPGTAGVMEREATISPVCPTSKGALTLLLIS